MASSPLASVVTPSFNQARFIEETLRSVALQTYRPIQQIVIDGGSTDGTVDILKRWNAGDHGPGYTFEWISEPDRGHADALNKGFARVRGEIVAWLNSDDVCFDRKVLDCVVAAFQAHPDVDMVHGEVALISEDSGLQMILCYPKFEYDRALRGYMLSQPTVFFRSSITSRYRLNSDARPAIDYDYWLQIGREHKFLKIHRILAGDRDHGERISRVSQTALAEAGRKVCAAYGSSESTSALAKFQDLVLLRGMRIAALFYLMRLLFRSKLADGLAFPGWIDSVPRLLARQLTMRVNERGGMGPTSPVSET